jgi:hypothetical protein
MNMLEVMVAIRILLLNWVEVVPCDLVRLGAGAELIVAEVKTHRPTAGIRRQARLAAPDTGSHQALLSRITRNFFGGLEQRKS